MLAPTVLTTSITLTHRGLLSLGGKCTVLCLLRVMFTCCAQAFTGLGSLLLIAPVHVPFPTPLQDTTA